MKILFVYTDINTMGFGGMSYHFGIGMLSAVLKQSGHETRLFHAQNKSQLKRIFKEVDSFKPDVIGFTSDTSQIGYVKETLLALRKLNVFTILGGCHASLYPNCLAETEGLDAICVGEGEETLQDLMDVLGRNGDVNNVRGLWTKRSTGKIVSNPTRPFILDLDALPFSDYDLFDFQSIINSNFGRVLFMLSRGCPFTCTYCSGPALSRLQKGRYVRFMSIERALDEIRYVKSKYRFEAIMFVDDTFTSDKEYVFEFCTRYKKSINIPFEVNARVETISGDLLKALREAGCFRISMGVEHGNEDFRVNVLGRKMSNDQIIQAFTMIKEAGIACKSFNMVGLPFETKLLHKSTIELNKQIKPEAHVCTIFQPYPGTKLYDICKENDFLDYNGRTFEAFSWRGTPLSMSDFPPTMIVKCHRNFSYKIYKDDSLFKALIYKLYYSFCGEKLVRFFSPIKGSVRKIVNKIGT